jgi:hypothetical protein
MPFSAKDTTTARPVSALRHTGPAVTGIVIFG